MPAQQQAVNVVCNAMETLRRTIILYFSSLIALVVIIKIFNGEIFSYIKPLGLFLLPLFVVAIAQFIGFIANYSIDKIQKKQKVFNISYLITFVGFTLTTFYLMYSSWHHEKHFANIEANKDHFRLYSGDYALQEKIAFDSLSKLLVDPNIFQLRGNIIKPFDTIINGQRDTIYLITLIYELQNNELTNKAEFVVIGEKAKLNFYNLPLDKKDHFFMDSLLKKGTKDIDDAINLLPDSMKNEIKELL
jgi:hypothetical protein